MDYDVVCAAVICCEDQGGGEMMWSFLENGELAKGFRQGVNLAGVFNTDHDQPPHHQKGQTQFRAKAHCLGHCRYRTLQAGTSVCDTVRGVSPFPHFSRNCNGIATSAA